MFPVWLNQTKWLHVLFVILILTSFSQPISIDDSQNIPASREEKLTYVPSVAVMDKTPVNSVVDAEVKAKPLPYLEQFDSIEVMATGYTAGVESTGKTSNHPQYGITYSGVKVRKATVSTIAADTKLFPLGTLLYIPGYGYGLVADTGSAIKGNKIDLYFLTRNQVYEQWGKKQVKVYVIMKGEGKVTEMMLDRLNAVKAFVQEPLTAQRQVKM